MNLFKASSTPSQRRELWSSPGRERRIAEFMTLAQWGEMYGKYNIKVPAELHLNTEKCKVSVSNEDY